MFNPPENGVAKPRHYVYFTSCDVERLEGFAVAQNPSYKSQRQILSAQDLALHRFSFTSFLSSSEKQ